MNNFNIVIAQKSFQHGLNKPTIFILNEKQPLNKIYNFIESQNIKILYIFGQNKLRVDQTIRIKNIYSNTQEYLVDMAQNINIDMFINFMNVAIISFENQINDSIRLLLFFLKLNGETRMSWNDLLNKLNFNERQEMEQFFSITQNFLSKMPEDINKTNIDEDKQENFIHIESNIEKFQPYQDKKEVPIKESIKFQPHYDEYQTKPINNNAQLSKDNEKFILNYVDQSNNKQTQKKVEPDYERILNTQQQAISETYVDSSQETEKQLLYSNLEHKLDPQQSNLSQNDVIEIKASSQFQQDESSFDSSLFNIQPYYQNGQNQNRQNLEEYEKKYLYNNQNQSNVKLESETSKMKIISENYIVVQESNIKSEFEIKPNIESKQKIKIISESYIVVPEESETKSIPVKIQKIYEISSPLIKQNEETQFLSNDLQPLSKYKLPNPVRFSNFIPQNGFQCLK